jgi:aspartyl aminopeptidase
VQRYANRSDLPGGSTLGSIATTQTPMRAVDIGLAQLAMHSCYETMGSADYAQLVAAMTVFYSKSLTVTGESWQWK